MTVLMRALNLSNYFITWTSTSPDYDGTYAPEAIQSDSAIVVADTGGGTIENIGKLGLEYDPVGLWLFNDNELTPAQVVAEYNKVLGGKGIVYPAI